MSVQINVAANQAALTASIQAGVQAYNQRFAQNNPINLSINQRAFSQPLGRITGDVKDFEAALAASNARVIAFGASTAVLGGVIRSFKELANVTIEVEKNLADINRVFGLTTSQLQKFSTDLFNVTKQTASSFNDASQAALEFSRQGLKAEETLQRTKDALTLTRLAGISTANAVDALTSTVNGFAATGITTSQILNKLVAVEQDFAVGAGDLAEALSRTGQAAQEAGVSLDQLNALVTSAQQSTARGGAVIGNALKTIFTRLQRTDTLDQLEAFNISVRDVQGNILPAVTILQNFAGAYQNLADAQRAQLSEQVAGVYQVNILKAIVNDLNKSQGVYAGALQRGAMATNEAEVATAKLNQTLDALLKQTATSTQQLANNIGKVTFEPLARYGTEQLKSLVESMNEILEGEGIGSTFANGLLKGIRNILAGPGAIAAFFTLFKLIQNSFTYLTQALPQIAGITTETQNRKNIEQSILQIMAQQGPVAQALAGTMGNQAAQAQLLLQVARQQTAEYQTQTALARQLAAQLAGQGVRVRGSGGLQVTRAGGYIPASTKLAEVVGAQAGGYSPGRVVSSPVGGVMNTAEDVKYIPGFAQPFINPPAGSKAGRKHRQNAISRTGVDPYMAGGFIPNFTLPSIYEKEYGLPLLAGRVFESLLRGDDYISLTEHRILADIDKGPFAAPPKEAKLSGKAAYNDKNLGIGKPKGSELALPLTAIKDYDEKLKDRGINISRVGYTHPELFAKAKEIVNREKGNKNTNISRIKLFDGFIPNFATPMSTASIPWFKKYSSKYKNAAGDTDLFKMGDFPTYGRGLDHEYAKKGNSAMLSYLHEDFVRSALNIALGSKKVIRPAEVGFKNKPVSDIANENDFDLLYRIADGSYSMLELKQDFKNISGSVTGFMNKKLANLEKENPALAKKVSSMIAVSNRPKFTDATGRNAGANFSEFEMAAASIVKDKYSNVDPSISAKLTKVTDGLLRRYEAKKNISSGGFIPNFAKFKSRFGTATLGKTDPIDLEFFGKTLGRKIKPSDIVSIEDLTTKGKGNASNLYGDIANSIKGKGGIFGYALAQNRSVDSSKVKDPLARLKAKYPQIAKRIGLGGETFISGDYGQNIVKASTMQDLVKYQDQILKMVDPAVLTLKSFANGFIPNFASRREMFRDLIKFNLDSAPNNQNILGGKTTLFRGVRNNKNSIFGQSRNYSQTENSRDYFRNTDIDKIANDHISEKKLLPFVSASIDKDIAEHFARGRRDDNLLGSGVVGSKTIKNSRIFSEQSIRKFIDKYGEKALKDIMLELSNWGSLGYGKGMAINFQSFSQKKGFEGTDFAKEISFLSNGFIPNLASGTDIYKGYAFNNTGKIYNDLYHSDAWDSIEGSTAGAIKYAYHNNKLLLQTNKAISPILKKAFLSRGVPESAFSPVEDVDSMMRSKNKQEIDDKLKNLGSVQLSSGIQAILEKGYYRKLIKGQQFYNIPGGVSPEELKIFGGVDGWVKYQEQNYGPLKWGSYASGFIPNLANFIDVDTLGKNSVHYSGDLMKLIKDIEASIGRNLSSGELRFLTNPKTNLSKLNDPKVLNKFINSERKGGFAGFANGFVPNFAYKQAVMGLEESMSGNKAIFDTKPFPHIRNSSQPTFSSAISDHGGLSNALSDSMRGQKAAGLMSKGFVPNFAQVDANTAFPGYGYTALNASEKQAFDKLNAALLKLETDTTLTASQMKALKSSIRLEAKSLQTSTGMTEIVTETNKALADSIRKNIAAQRASTNTTLSNNRNTNNNKSSLTDRLLGLGSNPLGMLIAPILGSAIAGQFAYGNKKSYELNENERMKQNFANTGVTAISTGASIGTMILPGWGTAIGAAVGGLIAFSEATKAAKLSITDLKEKISETATKQIDLIKAYKSSVENLISASQSPGDKKSIDLATKNLALSLYGMNNSQLKGLVPEEGKQVDLKTLETAITQISQKAGSQISALSATEKFSASGNKEISMMDRIVQSLSEAIVNFTDDVSRAFGLLGDGLNKILTSVLKDVPFSKTIEYLNKGFTGFFDYLSSELERVGLIFENITSKLALGMELVALDIKNFFNPLRNAHEKAKEENALAEKQQKSRQSDKVFEEAMRKNYVKNAAAKVNMLMGSVGLSMEALGGGSGKSETAKAIEGLTTNVKSLSSEFVSRVRQEMGERKILDFDMNKIVAKYMSSGGADSIDFYQKFQGDSKISDFAGRIAQEPNRNKRDTIIEDMLSYVNANRNDLLEEANTLGTIFRNLSETGNREGQFLLSNFNKFLKVISELAKGGNDTANTIKRYIFDFTRLRKSIEESFIQFNNATDLKQVSIEGRYARNRIMRDEQAKRMENFGKPFDAATERFQLENFTIDESFRKESVSSDKSLVSIAAGLKDVTNVGDPLIELQKLTTELQNTDTPFEERAKKLEDFIRKEQNFLNNDNKKGLEDITKAQNIAAISKEKNKEDKETANYVYNQEIRRLQEARNFKLQLKSGLSSLSDEGNLMIGKLGRDLPKMFADGLVSGIKAAIKESDNLGEALMGIAGNFLDAISTAMMQAAVYSMLGSMGFNMAGAAGSAPAPKQKGGFIRAQSGMYISGTGSGDKYPALLENGEYVLNRNAVMAMGGPAELDKLNFSMAPRFASGGSFATELNDIKSMEEGMTTFGLENSKVYNELRDAERAKQAEKRRKAAERRKMIAGLVGSVVGMAASFGIMKAAGSFGSSLKKDFGDVTMNVTPQQLTQNANLAQKGGHIGTRLSDTIPAYAEGGLYSSPIVKKYGVGMQNGGMYGGSSNNSNTVTNTNATNSFNFNTTVNRDGTIQMGADSTSYKQQDVELSNNLNSQVYKTVLDVIKQQQRFGGTLAGTRRPI